MGKARWIVQLEDGRYICYSLFGVLYTTDWDRTAKKYTRQVAKERTKAVGGKAVRYVEPSE